MKKRQSIPFPSIPEGLKALTDKEYWEDVWKNVKLPITTSPVQNHELDRIFRRLLPRSVSFIEIGCAPGSWMSYFAKEFGYSVSGIEYAPMAAELTKRNLEYLNIPAEIFTEDFLSYKFKKKYDVVFSGGFIEHFDKPLEVIGRIVDITNPNRGIVITVIPTVPGVNKWVSKIFRPKVAAKHFTITLKELIAFYEAFNVKTVYAGYLGCLKILVPIDKNEFAKKHELLTFLFNLPFRCWNKVIDTATRVLNVYPQIGVLSTGILHIGKRT